MIGGCVGVGAGDSTVPGVSVGRGETDGAGDSGESEGVGLGAGSGCGDCAKTGCSHAAAATTATKNNPTPPCRNIFLRSSMGFRGS